MSTSNLTLSEKMAPNTGDSVLVLTEPPVGIEFGIDCITYETGPKFRGLSMIPTGLHFIFYGTGMGARQGFFVNIAFSQVVVNTWDAVNEQILPFHSLSSESFTSLLGALQRGDLNSELGPYPLHQHHLWKNNSTYISEQVLISAQCSPGTLLFPGDETAIFGDSSGLIAGTQTKIPVVDTHDASKPHFRDLARTACFVDLEGAEAALLDSVPRDAYRPAKLTSMMMDKSALLEHLITSVYGGKYENLMGELQLSFMLFMLLYSYPALQHWKSLVNTICSSEAFLTRHVEVTAAFMKVFYNQLSFSPVDFFESELSKDNFLRPVVASLFSSLDGSGAATDEHLKEHQRRLFLFLRKKFNLFGDRDSGQSTLSGDFSAASLGLQMAGDEEEGPVVVSEEEIRSLQQYAREVNGSGGENEVVMECSDDSRIDLKIEKISQVETGGQTACAERWSEIDRQLLSSQSHSLAGTQIPLSVVSAAPRSLLHAAITTINTPPPHPAMSAAEVEAGLFGWRYPLLFESMLRSQGREDLTMAAARVLDQRELGQEFEEGDAVDGRTASGRFAEAQRYLQDEVTKRTAR